MHSTEVEIERNYAVFKELLRTLLPTDKGRYALLHNQTLCGVYDSAGEAEIAGFQKFGKVPYSIQEINPEPIDLGFFSYAASSGTS